MKTHVPRFFSLAFALLVAATSAHADLTAPAYNSRPGAAYTVFLDFGGFDYSGTWAGKTPGSTPAYTIDNDATTFSSAEKSSIQQIWARAAEKYAAFNVNVTTVDPAVAAVQASSDSVRQAYYDSTARVMHTVVGGGGSWIGGGGYSYIGTTQNAYPGNLNGAHTNWVFAAEAPTNLQFVAEASAHENGHGFGLNHQSDTTTNPVTEYSPGDNAGPSNGNSSVAPIMGVSYYNQRGLFRIGTMDTGGIQNDVQTILGNSGLSLVDDGIGHSLVTATSLALSGSSVNSLVAQGILEPASAVSPNPLGADSYTKDVFAFKTNGSTITLQLNAGGERIATGVADPGATFDGYLNILNSSGIVVAQGTRSANTLFSTYTGTLAAGNYYAQIVDFGGYTSTRELNAQYYTMGSYFLTGTGGFQAVPEPEMFAILGLGTLAMLRRRRSA